MNDMIYIPCECHTEGVVINHDDETKTFDLSFVTNNKHALQLGWIERFKLCWRVLTTGKIYNDQVIISKQSAKLMVNHLIKHGVDIHSIETYTVDETDRTETI